ncbi:MAG: nitroreductase [Lachnospiraceae bacterium]|nr:nitroreductase [Lachnospiraceae bacterium]
MNQSLENILTRRSIKKFKSDMVPKEILEQIVEAGTYAATGRNLQAPIILAVTKPEIREQLRRMNAQILGNPETDPFYGAPVVLVVLADKSVHTGIYDGSLVMGNLMLAAHALGVGSCWIHRAKEEFESAEGRELLKSLGIEGDYEGIGHCVLGYADCEEPAAKPRKANWTYWVE